VGGSEVTNPRLVTSAYVRVRVRRRAAWKLRSLSSTRLLGQ
jgi:hypothetical protein